MFNRANLAATWLRRPRRIAAQQRDEGVASTSPAIALGSRRGDRSTINALQTPMNRERTAHTRANGADGFTLVELLVTMGVLVLVVFLFTQLLNSAATTMTLGNKRMDADSQARQLLDRMAIDFDQMLKRTDVSYYVKTGTTPPDNQVGNDQIAFFSAVPGYYPSSGEKSPLSLVSYRVNNNSASSSYNKLERLGKGLVWNGVSTTDTPAVFLPLTIANTWCQATITGTPSATCTGTPDPNYEVIGPDVFRFEYYYLLSSSPSLGTPNQLSAGPWSNVNSFVIKDVAAIVVAIAIIDPKSKVLLNNDQIAALAGTLPEFPTVTGSTPGQLLTAWRTALDANTVGLPQPAISGVRLYERYFYLTQ